MDNLKGKVCEQNEEEMEMRRGPWTVEEDFSLIHYIAQHGEGRWNSLARSAGLNRTGKSCRLRWLNYLRPDVRRGNITLEEQLLILELHSRWGNRWSKIAQCLPGRTDNEIKNYWRTRVQKHAKQLKCDVNSKQFKDTMRYHWMPRLVERIQAQAANRAETEAEATTVPNSTATSCDDLMNTTNYKYGNVPPPGNDGGNIQIYSPENSSIVASSDSFGTTVSELTDCYNNYHGNQGNDQDFVYQGNELLHYGDQSLISPTVYFSQDLDFMEQNRKWMDGGDLLDNLWNDIDDLWFMQQ